MTAKEFGNRPSVVVVVFVAATALNTSSSSHLNTFIAAAIKPLRCRGRPTLAHEVAIAQWPKIIRNAKLAETSSTVSILHTYSLQVTYINVYIGDSKRLCSFRARYKR
jgi:hypothetical protein